MGLLLGFVGLVLFNVGWAADGSNPCAQYASAVSTLTLCSTASAFCSSYLKSIGGSVSYTKSFTVTTTKIKTQTSTKKPPTTVTTSVTPTTVTVTSTEASCPMGDRLRERAASSSCGLRSNAPQASVSGACNCILASSKTATKTISGSKTITAQQTSTITKTLAAPSSTVCVPCPQTTGDLVVNGGFENGINPWTIFEDDSQYSNQDVYITSPGAYGKSAHSVNITDACHKTKCNSQIEVTIQQIFDTCPGQYYLLTFSYLIPEYLGSGYIPGLILYYARGPSHTIQAGITSPQLGRDNIGGVFGAWNTRTFLIANGNAESLGLDVQCFGQQYCLLDDISLTPTDNSALIVNGNFETGSLQPWWGTLYGFNITSANLDAFTIASPGHNSNYAALLIAKTISGPSGDTDSASQPALQTYFSGVSQMNYTLTFSYLRYPNQTGEGALFLQTGFTDTSLTNDVQINMGPGLTDNYGGVIGSWNTISYDLELPQSILEVQFELTCSAINGSLSVAVDDVSVALNQV